MTDSRTAKTNGLGSSALPPDGEIPDVIYMLGTVEDGPAFNMSVSIDEAEYEALFDAVGAIYSLEHPMHLRFVERNFSDLTTLHRFATLTLSFSRKHARPDQHKLSEALVASIVNWLSSFRLHLDHERARLTREYGRKSSEVAAFNSALEQASAESRGYRITWALRNYVVHCRLPYPTVEVVAAANPSDLRIQDARFEFDANDLLSRYNEWGPAKADLKALGKFDLLPIAEEAMDALGQIFVTTSEIDTDRALAGVPLLVDALDRVTAAGGEEHRATIFKIRPTPDGRSVRQLTPANIPASAVRDLQKILDGTVDRSTLWAMPGPPPPAPALDPDSIERSFHRDSQAVAVLTTRFRDGFTPEFVDTVNNIIRSGDGPGPLISGLLDMSTVLSHMAASLMGTTPEALLTGMLDMYGHQPSTSPQALSPSPVDAERPDKADAN